jgi:hypothetical protein
MLGLQYCCLYFDGDYVDVTLDVAGAAAVDLNYSNVVDTDSQMYYCYYY